MIRVETVIIQNANIYTWIVSIHFGDDNCINDLACFLLILNVKSFNPAHSYYVKIIFMYSACILYIICLLQHTLFRMPADLIKLVVIIKL